MRCIGTSNEATFTPIISYFYLASASSEFGPGKGSPLELSEYILMILSHLILTGKPNDQPHRDLINIYVHLSRGFKLPLDAMALGYCDTPPN